MAIPNPACAVLFNLAQSHHITNTHTLTHSQLSGANNLLPTRPRNRKLREKPDCHSPLPITNPHHIHFANVTAPAAGPTYQLPLAGKKLKTLTRHSIRAARLCHSWGANALIFTNDTQRLSCFTVSYNNKKYSDHIAVVIRHMYIYDVCARIIVCYDSEREGCLCPPPPR